MTRSFIYLVSPLACDMGLDMSRPELCIGDILHMKTVNTDSFYSEYLVKAVDTDYFFSIN